MLDRSGFESYLKKIKSVKSRQQGHEYRIVFRGDHLEGKGVGSDTVKARSPFRIPVDNLYEAYRHSVNTTTELKKYVSGKQSPSLAVLDEIRRMEKNKVINLKEEPEQLDLGEMDVIPKEYNEDALALVGFEGFLKIEDCRKDYAKFPELPGVYIVLRRNDQNPKFLSIGSGGYFKGKNPNVGIQELNDNWVSEAKVVYIGMTTSTLKKRLSAYLNFGKGARVGHKGGRFIWQLEDHEELVVCWKTMSCGSPKEYETELIRDFKNRYGKRPFANLVD